MLERLLQKNFQFVLVDPEGDYENFEDASGIGSSQHPITADGAVQHLKTSEKCLVVNLLGTALAERPEFLGTFLPRVKSLRDGLGRPHCIAIDEAHHMLPRGEEHILQVSAYDMTGMILIIVHPDELSTRAFV